ncbi:GNAT family N-acetyltransferase [Alteromonas halophila]|uniref:Acetyltransferase n=1 Tax=Alteromonas halophila TaxID=516698 RepID=A0A918JIY8_9ALTE|nr:GNAT family N-acetyltransferase [Alteromonas halophila]GGW79631.1 acetyltransferase [Alteromonas halophila]
MSKPDADKLEFRPTRDLKGAAALTLTNMRTYYDAYQVSWDEAQIAAMTAALYNLDILLDNRPVGVLRLSLDDGTCWIRDLQVIAKWQNHGIGARALKEAQRYAQAANVHILSLKVFKISPAVSLYLRHGFRVVEEDDRFYYMQRDLRA